MWVTFEGILEEKFSVLVATRGKTMCIKPLPANIGVGIAVGVNLVIGGIASVGTATGTDKNVRDVLSIRGEAQTCAAEIVVVGPAAVIIDNHYLPDRFTGNDIDGFAAMKCDGYLAPASLTAPVGQGQVRNRAACIASVYHKRRTRSICIVGPQNLKGAWHHRAKEVVFDSLHLNCPIKARTWIL